MAISVRYAQKIDPAEVAAAIPGAVGDTGEQGPPGDPAQELPVKYLSTTEPTVTISASQSRRFRVKMTADVEVKFSGWRDGMKFSISFLQADGGGWLVTWPANIRWANGGAPPSLTATDGQRDTFGFERFKSAAADSFDGFVIGQDI